MYLLMDLVGVMTKCKISIAQSVDVVLVAIAVSDVSVHTVSLVGKLDV
jgi:hypothetical protein